MNSCILAVTWTQKAIKGSIGKEQILTYGKHAKLSCLRSMDLEGHWPYALRCMATCCNRDRFTKAQLCNLGWKSSPKQHLCKFPLSFICNLTTHTVNEKPRSHVWTLKMELAFPGCIRADCHAGKSVKGPPFAEIFIKSLFLFFTWSLLGLLILPEPLCSPTGVAPHCGSCVSAARSSAGRELSAGIIK